MLKIVVCVIFLALWIFKLCSLIIPSWMSEACEFCDVEEIFFGILWRSWLLHDAIVAWIYRHNQLFQNRHLWYSAKFYLDPWYRIGKRKIIRRKWSAKNQSIGRPKKNCSCASFSRTGRRKADTRKVSKNEQTKMYFNNSTNSSSWNTCRLSESMWKVIFRWKNRWFFDRKYYCVSKETCTLHPRFCISIELFRKLENFSRKFVCFLSSWLQTRGRGCL